MPEMQLRLTQEEVAQLRGEPKNTNVPLELVVFWDRGTAANGELNLDFRIEFVDPAGTILIDDAKGSVHMPAHLRKFYTVIKMEKGIPCAQPGVHTFRVVASLSEGEQVLLEEPFEIKMFNIQHTQIT